MSDFLMVQRFPKPWKLKKKQQQEVLISWILYSLKSVAACLRPIYKNQLNVKVIEFNSKVYRKDPDVIGGTREDLQNSQSLSGRISLPRIPRCRSRQTVLLIFDELWASRNGRAFNLTWQLSKTCHPWALSGTGSLSIATEWLRRSQIC